MNLLSQIAAAAAERRRRLLSGSGALPPGGAPFNPDAPSPIPAPNVPIAMPTMPSREAPLPEFNPGISRADELGGARDEALGKREPRWKTALRGSLRGLAQGLATGGGIGGAVGGAAAGALHGGINPRGLRETEFTEQTLPQIQERWGFEDRARADARQAAADALDAEYRRAQIGAMNRSNLPQLQRPRSPIRSDRGLYDPETERILPGTEPLPKEERPPGPHWVRDERGRFVNLHAPENKGRVIRGYDRPRAPRQPKAAKKYASITDVREAAQQAGMSESQMAAEFKRQGYEIVR